MHWKDHFVTAVVTSVGTFGVCSTMFATLIIPTMVASRDAEIAELKREYADKESRSQLLTQVAKLEEQVRVLQIKAASYESANVFAGSSAYPMGFRKVKLGDSADEIAYEYRFNKVEWTESTATVDVDSELFEQLFFVFSKDTSKNIHTILYHFSFDRDINLHRSIAESMMNNLNNIEVKEINPTKPPYYKLQLEDIRITINTSLMELSLHDSYETIIDSFLDSLDTLLNVKER